MESCGLNNAAIYRKMRANTRRQRRQKRRTYKRRGGAYALGRAAMAAAAVGALPGSNHSHEPHFAHNHHSSHVNIGPSVKPTFGNFSSTQPIFLDAQGKLVSWAQTQTFKNTWINGVSNAVATPKPAKGRNVDLCAEGAPLCEGHMGIPRIWMPQIDLEHTPAFRKFALEHDGIESSEGSVLPTELKPTQREISTIGVEKLASYINSGQMRPDPIIVSADGYVVDGHHRWAAYVDRTPDKPIPVITMAAPIQKVLESAAAWRAPVQAFAAPLG